MLTFMCVFLFGQVVDGICLHGLNNINREKKRAVDLGWAQLLKLAAHAPQRDNESLYLFGEFYSLFMFPPQVDQQFFAKPPGPPPLFFAFETVHDS